MGVEVRIIISVGELLDKLSILRIKKHFFKDDDKLANVKHEYNLLAQTWQGMHANIKPAMLTELYNLYDRLCTVNKAIWEMQSSIREHEREQLFDDEFIQLARQLYINDDLRSSLKKQINIKIGSAVVEEKSF
jgi:putative sterol carrier protein